MLNKFFDKFKSKNPSDNEDEIKDELKNEKFIDNYDSQNKLNDSQGVFDEKITDEPKFNSHSNNFDTLINDENQYFEERQFSNDNENLGESDDLNEGFFEKLKKSLLNTRDNISSKIDKILAKYRTVDEELFEEIEETLISADIGVETTLTIVEQLKNKVKLKNIKDSIEVKKLLEETLKENLENIDNNFDVESKTIILVVGVNGVGKTTTIGKLAMKFKNDNKKVIMVAADTFRAAAIEQLTEWGKRASVDIVSHEEGSDPASVVFDGISSMKSKNADILICDTAGRLHNKKNLMNELNKIKRVIEKEYPQAKKEILLIVDGTTGQNAIIQAKEFMNATDLTGAIITKLDGTAKGGMVFPLEMELGIAVKFIGIGEQVNDLVQFEPGKFVEAILN
ncbi:signal recognition particle-docking protein FtsY [uncultured Finegoldia sp.]|uniref:signal recognition particle-docking protein FtsY n=1 Tax=uncultured Finegoldia sp. TaxID=328009 RepID=UPI002626D5A8|nr:signal recognition particle-docking protein FtsY [uncultured Finegoldia sp.]